ncbi:alpha/beta hydrolase [Thermocoleostomius sinensis]|uniref:Alpha/beta hydrolase n=1 Tax=Thermocoleostomius sinensis A174 TaxID=2016057 RepID=A0A9E9C9V0_9CYAN|nr:alpha/beta hydrolase [Thermocoleostomius sinensis]WAL62043.1 alpha/beta hydrolase [Thermocoleostomius sinensis A174]
MKRRSNLPNKLSTRKLSTRLVLWLSSGLIGLYLGLCLLLRVGQSHLIFHPPSTLAATPADVDLNYEDVYLTADSGYAHAWWIPSATPNAPVLLYLHGNASNVGDLVHRADRLHQLGFSVLLLDYRGYGFSSPGLPTEATVYEDAQLAWNYLTQARRIPPHQIVVFGQSLGGAVAIELATRQPDMGGIILESTFTSMRDMVDHTNLSRLFPTNLILTQQFDSLAKVPTLQVPSLFIHGAADNTIPVRMSQALFAAAPQPKYLLIIPAATHNDVAQLGGSSYLETIQEFVNQYTQL